MNKPTQIVDPFVVARPQPVAVKPKTGRPQMPGASKPSAYRPPAGPMHARFRPDVQGPAQRPTAQPAPARPAFHEAPRLRKQHDFQPLTEIRPRRPQAAAEARLSTRPAVQAAPRPNPEAWPKELLPATMEQPATKSKAKAKTKTRRFKNPVRTVALLLAGVCLGALSLFSLQLGELALAVYLILALWRRWPSRQAFAMALGTFAGIVVTTLVSSWRPLADNLAVYAFLLLCAGTVLMAVEMRRAGGRDASPVKLHNNRA